MSWGHLSKIVTRMDEGDEPPVKVLWLVLDRCPQFMSRAGLDNH